MKACTKCGMPQSLEAFGKFNQSKDGLAYWCKECYKKYRKQNKKNITIAKAKHYSINKEKILEQCKEDYPKYKKRIREYNKRYPQENKEKLRKRRLERYKESPEKILGWTNKRRAAKFNASPLWLTKQHLSEIEQYYRLAWSRGMFEEQKFHVDHIIPLQGKNVQGLHVPWNLQVITARENIAKGNKTIGECCESI